MDLIELILTVFFCLIVGLSGAVAGVLVCYLLIRDREDDDDN